MNPGIIIALFVFLLCISSAIGVYMYMEKQTADQAAKVAEKAEEESLEAAKVAEKAEADALVATQKSEEEALEAAKVAEKARADALEAKRIAAEAKAEADRLQAIEDSKVITRYNVGVRGGPAQADLICPEGAFVTGVYGKSTEYLDNFGAKCSDGTDLGNVGLGRGEPYTITSETGFSKFQASNPTTGWGLRTVSFFNEGVKINENPLGYAQGGELYFTDCKNTETGGADSGKIVGFKLGHGDAIERIQLVCEKKELPILQGYSK